MRSKEYMEAVETALTGYDEGMVKELLASLGEHFEMGLAAGKSEEELCKELGPVEDLLGALEAAGQEHTAGPAGEGAVEQGSTNGDNEKPASLTLLEGQDADKEEPAVTRICAELGFADIKLLPTRRPMPYIQLQKGSDEPESFRLEEAVEGDTYTVRLVRNIKAGDQDNPSILQQFVGRLVGATAPIGINLALELYIPEGMKSLYLKQSSGDVSVEGLHMPGMEMQIISASGEIELEEVHVKKLQAQSTSGDVELTSCSAASMEVKSVSGDVDLERLNAAQLTGSTTSGDMELTSCAASEGIKLNTMSGDATLTELQTQFLEVSTISGDVDFEVQCAGAVINSTSGDVNGAFRQDVAAKISTVSGDLTLTLKNEQRGLRARVNTVSGDVQVRYGGNRGHYGRKAEIRAGIETSSLELHTVSGDIGIYDR